MLISTKNIYSHLPFKILFVAFLITGLFIFKNYGMSWDEEACRTHIAIPTFKYLLNNDYQAIQVNEAKYHGAAFELILFPIEKILGLKDMRDIFLMRHLMTFFLFALSVIFFYLLCFRHLKSQWLALTGAVFLVLSPRIFADSFYNVKDVAFLSLVIIGIYTTLIFLEKKTYKSAAISAIASAFLIDLRVMGIIIPIFAIVMLAIELMRDSDNRKKLAKVFGFFFLALITFTILFWPLLWHDPIGNFIGALKEASKFPWVGYVLYNGGDVYAANLPWHYIPFWILITTPVVYSLLFLAGVIALANNLFIRKKINTPEILNAYIFFGPIGAVIILHSVLYDGWRHLYYVYPSFIFISICGLQAIFGLVSNLKLIKSIYLGIAIYCIYMIAVMFNLHPYQNLYFNFIAGKSLGEIKNKFELDYWCVSYKEGIEHILKTDTSSCIIVYCTEPSRGTDNAKLLPESERARLSFTESPELADYFITGFRYKRGPFKGKPDFNVIRDGGVVLSVYDIKNKKLQLNMGKYQIARFFNSYEPGVQSVITGKVIEMKDAFSGSHVELVNKEIEYASGLLYNPAYELTTATKSNKYIHVSFQIRTPEEYEFKLVIQMDSKDNMQYQWIGYDLQSSLKDKWVKKVYNLILPDINATDDGIKFYIWNPNKKEFFIDDLEVSFYAVHESEIKAVKAALP